MDFFQLFDRANKNSKKGTIKFLELLDKQGADFSSADGEGQTPLHLATNARNHDGACVKYLIKKINRKLSIVATVMTVQKNFRHLKIFFSESNRCERQAWSLSIALRCIVCKR